MITVALVSFLSTAVWSAPKTCPPDKYPVRAHQQRAYYKADGTFVSAGWKEAFCRRYTSVRKIWLPRLNSGCPNPWINDLEKISEWKQDEQERVLDVLEELPQALLELLPQRIFRLQQSVVPDNPATSGGNNLALYDDAFSFSRNLADILVHEAAHYLYLQLEGKKDGFHKAAGWRKDKISGALKLDPKRKVLQPTDRLNPMEDFSDCIASYVNRPAVLKKLLPGIYNWIDSNLGPSLKKGRK